MNGLQLILFTLAVYRVSNLLALEDGPFDALAWVRGHIDPEQRTWVGRGVRCVLCISFWLSGSALLFGGSVLEWMAIAGAVHFLYKLNWVKV